MTQRDDPSVVAIRLTAVEAASRLLGPTPEPSTDRQRAVNQAAGEVVAAADLIVGFIRTGQPSW
jgi:hypothetical protein